MPKNNLEALNNHLFHLLENLTNPEDGTDMNLEIEKAKAAAQIGKQIIDGAKVKVAYCKITKQELAGDFFVSKNKGLSNNNGSKLLDAPKKTQEEINKEMDRN